MTSEFAVEMRDVVKKFITPEGNEMAAVDHVTMQIKNGEFFSMLGSSGCGKTTSLRMVAGFEWPTEGEVYIEGKAMGHTPPFQRKVNTVFQSYALFQHLTVYQNLAFGLEMEGAKEDEIKKRVGHALEMVQLTGMDRRKPKQLSGGQQQRVALARALVKTPDVLLLDEPLGALDLKLRQQMQVELKSIQQRVGITFIFVTHDQEEALTMSDRIAVFSQGKIEQVGTPSEVYEHPSSTFVAGFVGTSNLVSGEIAKRITGSDARFSIRPEKIHLAAVDQKPDADMFFVNGKVRDVVYLGLYTRYLVELEGGGDLVVVEQNLKTTSMDVMKVKNQNVRLLWKKEHASVVGG